MNDLCGICAGWGMGGYDKRGRPVPCSECDGKGRKPDPSVPRTYGSGGVAPDFNRF